MTWDAGCDSSTNNESKLNEADISAILFYVPKWMQFQCSFFKTVITGKYLNTHVVYHQCTTDSKKKEESNTNGYSVTQITLYTKHYPVWKHEYSGYFKINSWRRMPTTKEYRLPVINELKIFHIIQTRLFLSDAKYWNREILNNFIQYFYKQHNVYIHKKKIYGSTAIYATTSSTIPTSEYNISKII